MTLQGDLSTLDLADLLQNLEQHGRTGLLSLDGEQGAVRMYFQGGKLSLLATEERPTLMDVLAASGAVPADKIAAARKKRRRSRKSLGETLVAMKLIDEEALRGLARDRLLGDVCELMSAGAGAFTFEQRSIPRNTFDPEERRLELAIPAGPMLLEAARRADHWARIRLRVPSDATHFQAAPRAKRPAHLEEDALAGALLELCDGTRSVAEVASSFPHKRFDAYERIAELVEARTLRAVDAEDLARRALELADVDLDRAWAVATRGLGMHTQHRSLIEAQVELARRRDEPEAAVDALKRLAHLCWDSGELGAAREALDEARELDPTDVFLWERSLELALREERADDVQELGRGLAELHRKTGLHKKAAAVFETLLETDPERWELHREYARTLADSGRLGEAVQKLEHFGKRRLEDTDYRSAREVYGEILALDPSCKRAQETLTQVESGDFERMIAHRKVLVRRAVLIVAGVLLLAWLVLEGTARRAYVMTLTDIGERELIEDGNYAEAASLLEGVADSFPLTSTAWYDVPRQVAVLRAKAE